MGARGAEVETTLCRRARRISRSRCANKLDGAWPCANRTRPDLWYAARGGVGPSVNYRVRSWLQWDEQPDCLSRRGAGRRVAFARQWRDVDAADRQPAVAGDGRECD